MASSQISSKHMLTYFNDFYIMLMKTNSLRTICLPHSSFGMSIQTISGFLDSKKINIKSVSLYGFKFGVVEFIILMKNSVLHYCRGRRRRKDLEYRTTLLSENSFSQNILWHINLLIRLR